MGVVKSYCGGERVGIVGALALAVGGELDSLHLKAHISVIIITHFVSG